MNICHSRPKFIAITAAVVLAATSYCLGAVLSVPQYDQEQDQWCWNASSQMILAYYSKTYSQTAIANWAVGGRNIPNYLYDSPDPSMKGCDEVLLHFGNISSSGSSTSDSDLSSIPLSTLANEMANSRPVMIGVAWDQGGGHAIILRGTSGNSVYVNDPWPSNGQSIQTYDGVCRYLGNGTWNQTLRLTTNPAEDDYYTQYVANYNLAYNYYSSYQSSGSYLDMAYCYYYYAYAAYYYYMYQGDSSSASSYYNYYMGYAQYYYDLYNTANTYYTYYEYYYTLAYQYYYYASSYLDYAYCYYYYAYAMYYYYMYSGNSSYANYYYDYYMDWAYYYYYLYYG